MRGNFSNGKLRAVNDPPPILSKMKKKMVLVDFKEMLVPRTANQNKEKEKKHIFLFNALRANGETQSAVRESCLGE